MYEIEQLRSDVQQLRSELEQAENRANNATGEFVDAAWSEYDAAYRRLNAAIIRNKLTLGYLVNQPLTRYRTSSALLIARKRMFARKVPDVITQ